MNARMRVMEDLVRSELSRTISISRSMRGVLAGPHATSQWTHQVKCSHHPKFVRLALVKQFYFELLNLNEYIVKQIEKSIRDNLSELHRIPSVDLTRVLIRIPSSVAREPVEFWDEIFHVLLAIVNDQEWWDALEGRLNDVQQ